MYCTSRCQGTRPGTRSVTDAGSPHVTPSVERRCCKSTPLTDEVQPRSRAETDHMRHALALSRTIAGEITPYFSPLKTSCGADHSVPFWLVIIYTSSDAPVM